MIEYPIVDLALARRLEQTEARANVAFVEARAQLQPESGATWMESGGAYGMFDGVGSPLTQSFGLGMSGPVMDLELEVLESFFGGRGADVYHEISPVADPSHLTRLHARGYRPVEFTSVLFRPTDGTARSNRSRNEQIRVRPIEPTEADQWAEVAAEGWSESAELAAFMHGMGQISARSRGTVAFIAELEGRPIATGVLSLGDGVALLAGASTVPSGRGRGAQLALLDARMRFAAEHGCELAMMGASPGSASQRNAERQGFRIAYTRIKWHLGRI